MNIKVDVFNQEKSLITYIEDVEQNNIGKEVQDCINRFKEYYTNEDIIYIEVELS